jgi:hypothetical protein
LPPLGGGEPDEPDDPEEPGEPDELGPLVFSEVPPSHPWSLSCHPPLPEPPLHAARRGKNAKIEQTRDFAITPPHSQNGT